MNYKIVLVVAVCFSSALADNCTNGEPIELSLELVQCCRNNETSLMILDDPCFRDGNFTSIECMMECLYTENNLMVNDTIVLENVKKYFQSNSEKDRYINAAEFCDKFGKKNIIEKFAHLQMGAECRSFFMLFDTCVALNVIARCPESALTKSDYCTSQMKYLNQCVFSG